MSLKIALLSDSPFFPTGYSNQAKLLAKFLHNKGHEIHYLASGYQGANIENAKLTDGTEFPFKIYGQGKAQYFEDIMTPVLNEINPDAFVILLDTFMLFGNNGWFLNTDTGRAKTFFWYPSDGGGGMPVRCESILQKIDVPVAMAKFGQKQVKDYYGLDVTHIPHGTEKDRFYKLPAVEQKTLRNTWGIDDKFVIGVVARNQGRKMIDRTLKTMNALKDRIPEAILLMHLDPTDPAQSWDIRSLIRRYNLENRVVFTGMTALKGFGWDKMNEVYNAMDCFFLSTSGEGFGIPIIEAMSCRVPVVVTDYTTTPELVLENNSGIGVKLSGCDKIDMFKSNLKDYDNQVVNGTLTGSWEVERGLIDCKEAADKIYDLYLNTELRHKMGENGRNAVVEKYDFETIVGPQWEKLIKEKST